MHAQFLVITGTDTEVGKTRVATGMGRALELAGRRVVAVKPIESGCASDAPAATEDGVLLAQAAGQTNPAAALVRLTDAITPAAAADNEGTSIDFHKLMLETRSLGQDADVVLVEGAGGLLSPLTWRHTTLDLAVALNAPVLVVAANRLGALNHIRLTLNVLAATDVRVAAVVLSAPEVPDEATASNAATLAKLPDMPPVFTLPRVTTLNGAADALMPLCKELGL